MSSKVIAYTVNSSDRVTEVSSAWDEFASENQGDSVGSVDIIGTSLQDCYADSETASFYDQVFQQVRVTGDPTSIPFRCDSPSLRRFLRLAIYPKENGWLRLVSSPIRVEARASEIPLLNPQTVNPSLVAIAMCSICKSVQVHRSLWLDIDSAVKILHLGKSSPPSQQTVCPNCAKAMTECRHLLSSPIAQVGATSLPLVVVLRRLSDYWIPHPQPGTLPLEHPYHILSPFMWEYEPDPVDYILGRMEEVLEQSDISRSNLYLVAYEGAFDVFSRVLKQASSLFAAALVLNPERPVNNLDCITCPVGAVYENGALDNYHHVSSESVTVQSKIKTFLVPYSFHDCLYSTLADPHIGNWLFDCIKV